MNVKDILKAAGYEVLEEKINEDIPIIDAWQHCYKIRNSLEKVRMVQAALQQNDAYVGPNDLDIYDVFDVYVSEVGFNGYGDLFMELRLTDDPESCWDLIEFEDGKVKR